MKLSEPSLSLLENTIRQAIGQYAGSEEQSAVTDIHLQPNASTGELVLFDDDDNLLASAIIPEWSNYEADDFAGSIERIFTSLLHDMEVKGAFARLSILKPYSFVLVDENKETMADLLLMDDDTLLVNDELLKGLDDELDAFLKELLEK